MEPGDLVEAVPPFALACGSGIYRHAVIASVKPLIAISEYGDMLWRATITPDKLRVIGKANPEVMAVVTKRLNSGF